MENWDLALLGTEQTRHPRQQQTVEYRIVSCYLSTCFFIFVLSFRFQLIHIQFMDSMDLCKDSNSMKDSASNSKAPNDCVVPITPEAITENGDFQSQSPLTLSVVRKQLNLACIHCDSDSDIGNEIEGIPRTPKDGVLDPFAPGPDNMAMAMAMAPDSNKYLDECRTTAARRLDFHPSFDALSDEDMVESVYETLLQVIISKQAEGILAQAQVSTASESPPSALRFTGIAHTCPAAPIKPAAKPRNIDLALCKKLQF